MHHDDISDAGGVVIYTRLSSDRVSESPGTVYKTRSNEGESMKMMGRKVKAPSFQGKWRSPRRNAPRRENWEPWLEAG